MLCINSRRVVKYCYNLTENLTFCSSLCSDSCSFGTKELEHMMETLQGPVTKSTDNYLHTILSSNIFSIPSLEKQKKNKNHLDR